MSDRRDIIAAMGRHAVTVGAGVLTIALLGRGLGRAALGAWALIGTSATLVTIADLGLASSVLKHSVNAGEDRARAVRSVELAQWVTLAMLPWMLALSWWVYLAGLSSMVSSAVASPVILKVASLSALAGGAMSAYAAPWRAWLVGQGATTWIARARLTAAVVQIVVMIALLIARAGLAAPAIAVLVSNAIELALLVRGARSGEPALRWLPRRRPERAELVAGLRESFAALAVNAASIMAVRVDVAVLARVAPLAAVGAYQFSLRLSDQLYTLVKQVSAALQHRLGAHDGRAQLIARGTAIMVLPLATALGVLALAGRPALRAWAGSVVDEPLFETAVVLCSMGAVLAITCELASSALSVAASSQWVGAVPHVMGAMANGAVTLLGAQRFGVYAIAGGTIVGNALTLALTYRAVGRLHDGVARETFALLGRGAALVLVAFALALALRPIATSTVGSLLASAVSAGVAALLGLWWVRSMTAKESSCASQSLLPR